MTDAVKLILAVGRGQPGPATVLALRAAVSDPVTIVRYHAKLRSVPGSECEFFIGALSGRGHGRFWLDVVNGHGVVVIAHRFAWALEHGVDSLLTTPVLGHRCDNPACQRIHPEHVVASSPVENRREWAARRHTIGNPLRDTRGPRGRARALREVIRAGHDPDTINALAAAGLMYDTAQLPLWAAPTRNAVN